MSSNPRICFVEGNIGSGKSTFLQHLSQHPSFKDNSSYLFIQEPVDVWKSTTDSSNTSILQHFYSDMKANCYLFQSFAFISRINQLDNIDKNCKIVFIERSVFCDRNVFARTCYSSGLMSEIEWITYNTWFDWMLKKYTHLFDNSFYLYLKCSPETALHRICNRARNCESDISIDYLKTISSTHDDWLLGNPNTKTIVIDAEQNLLDHKNFMNVVNNWEKELFDNNNINDNKIKTC